MSDIDRAEHGVRPQGSLLILYPLIVDTVAFIVFLISSSRLAYVTVLGLADITMMIIALASARRGFTMLWQSLGISILVPAVLFAWAAAVSLAQQNGNIAFPLGSLRYLAWCLFTLRLIGGRRPKRGTTAVAGTGLPSNANKQWVWIICPFIAALAGIQLIFSTQLSPALIAIHNQLVDGESTNAVLTSIALGKAFASLTVRNPIELSYLGLALLCMSLSQRKGSFCAATAFFIVVAGRSNVAIVSALAMILIHISHGRSVARTTRLALLVVLPCILIFFAAFLPDIYLEPGASWDDLLFVLGQQRLGMLIALPDIAVHEGWRLLLFGTSQNLEETVAGLFASVLLPPLFEEGGAIAIFDVMWLGMLVVGGLPFVLGGVILIRASWRAGSRLRSFPEAYALRLYTVSILIMSFSSQVLLSRYSLYFLSFFLANLAARTPRLIEHSPAVSKNSPNPVSL